MNAETRAALALINAGVPETGVDRALRMLDLTEADTAETIAGKVDELRSDLPGAFGAARHPAASRTPRPAPAGSAAERGRAALERVGMTPKERADARWKTTPAPFGSRIGSRGGDAA